VVHALTKTLTLTLTLALAQGALLLVLFHMSHAVEHALTARARGGLGALAARVPAVATAVDAPAPGAEPDLASAREVPVGDVAVGQLTLVRPGEQARCGAAARWLVGHFIFVLLLRSTEGPGESEGTGSIDG